MADLSQRPSYLSLSRELLVLGDLARHFASGRRQTVPSEGMGRPVMVLPGFLADDALTAILRTTLDKAGYRSFGWALGRNFGVREDIFERLDHRLDAIEAQISGPVSLVGWSLGGLIAREYAKHAPQRIDRVITLGSPFSGDLRANHAWRLYEAINRHPVDRPPLAINLPEKPPVRTIALWSRRDGIVAPASSCGVAGEADQQVEVDCGHVGFVVADKALRAILAALRA